MFMLFEEISVSNNARKVFLFHVTQYSWFNFSKFIYVYACYICDDFHFGF